MIKSILFILIIIVITNYFIRKGVNTAWYKCLEPNISPPRWVFSFIWAGMYILLYLSFIHILKFNDKFLISIFVLHFILQISWSYYFFDKKKVDVAYIFMQMMILTILMLISFAKDNYTKYLLFPYLAWLFYAATLNTAALSSDVLNNCKKLI